jgi:hypothetical protein
MQQVLVKGKSFSKVVCGTNAFYGRSHFSEARDIEYRSRCDDDYIKMVIARCLEFGINAIESSANERIVGIIADLRQQVQTPIRFIGSTRVDKTSAMKSHQRKFRFLIENRADICIVHSQFVERQRATEEIRGLREFTQRTHEAGLIAGVSAHRVSTVQLCEDHDYGIDVYLFPLNPQGFVYPGYDGEDTVADRVRIVQNTPKPFILMKTLAAGRIPPNEGLQFALETAKPNDIVTLGLSSVEEVEESLSLALAWLEKAAPTEGG